MRQKKVEFTIERHERIFVKRSALTSSLNCPICGVLMITPEQAATVARVSLRTIFIWIEASRVHFTENSDHVLMICTASLPGLK
ncbi:MAG TPA: hypothetical protein VGQ39_15685 [Pyrinomonadaceae bacterium]|jgi:hypothetical protein|nr:hypothetical protein [Pyrinomonadaceae bacterium]